MKKTVSGIFITCAVLIANAEYVLAQSCPMCKESVAGSGERLAEGFYSSIMALVFLPATLVGGVSIFLLRANYLKKHPDSTLSTIGIIREYLRSRKNRDSE